ncbi:MAG: hypothetical protein HY225_00355 [Candidatus Vogelbacteria bacterium]|nr:hypothetical protein [Candidatus Vogelbacteria bacterium]
MLIKKVKDIEPHLDSVHHHGHTNFILEFFQAAKKQVTQYFEEIYAELHPLAHDVMSYVASKMYKLSSAAAQEFLRFYNFIQGRKELRSGGNTSSFITNIAEHKEAARNIHKRVTYQTANK